MTLGNHISELEKYTESKIDYVLFNSREMPKEILDEYKKTNQSPVEPDLDAEQKSRIKVIMADLISEEIYQKSSSDVLRRSILKHDPKKLATEITKLISHE